MGIESKKSLAIKYRPNRFEDVVEQVYIKKILQYQIKTNTLKNVYLFTGSAGTGKTTCARIFANEINEFKGNPIEIDAASNSGVDNVRSIIEDAKQRSISADYKIYIIDEAHGLSQGAWQAFLKLIEEPPSKTMFIFCTTDPQKIPPTILSRVQRYDFQRISFVSIVERLKYIVHMECLDEMDKGQKSINDKTEYHEPINYTVTNEALEYIAKIADGGMRDAITLLDKCLSYSNTLTVKEVTEALGISGYDEMMNLLKVLVKSDSTNAIKIIEDMHESGKDLKQFIKQFLSFVIDVEKYQRYQNFRYLNIPDTLKRELDSMLNEDLFYITKTILNLYSMVKLEENPKNLIEASLVVFCAESSEDEYITKGS